MQLLDQIAVNVLSNLVWFVLGLFMTFLLTLLRLIPGQLRRRRLISFFGLNPDTPVIKVYLSTLILQEPAQSFKNLNIVTGGYRGLAVPVSDLQLKKMFDPLLQYPLDFLPKYLSGRLAERYPVFRPIDIEIVHSPASILPSKDFKFESVISVGSDGYNSVTDYYVRNKISRLKLNGSPQRYGVEFNKGRLTGSVVPPIHPNSKAGLAILEKIVDQEHGTVAIVTAGAGLLGGMGSLEYLVQNWELLYKRYKDAPFAGILHFTSVRNDENLLVPVRQEWHPE